MKELILHIGAHKTGSTSLQDYLAMNRSLLLDSGVLYPEFARPDTYHHVLMRPLVEKKDNDFIWDIGQDCSYETTEDFSTYFKSVLSDDEIKKVVISSEFFLVNKPIFSNVVTSENLAKYAKEIFEGFFIRPVVYLRNPIDWIESCYVEAVKGAHTCYKSDFNQYWSDVKNYIFYEEYLMPWFQEFDTDVEIYIYESVLNESKDVIAHFTKNVIGLSLNEFLKTSFPAYSNPSLSKEFIDLLVQFNRINSERSVGEKYTFPYGIDDILTDRWFGKGKYLNKEIAAETLQYCLSRLILVAEYIDIKTVSKVWSTELSNRPDSVELINQCAKDYILVKQLCKLYDKQSFTEKQLQERDAVIVNLERINSEILNACLSKDKEIEDLVVRSESQIAEINKLVKRSDGYIEDIKELAYRSDRHLSDIKELVQLCDSLKMENKCLESKCGDLENTCSDYEANRLLLESELLHMKQSGFLNNMKNKILSCFHYFK